MNIRQYKSDDLEEIKRIVKSLHPKWFDKNALKNIPIDVKFQKCFVAEEGDVAGFVSVYSKDGEAWIGWIGVHPRHRNKKIGRKLVKKVEKELKNAGVKTLRVETVGETRPRYKPYYETVAFYETCGFSIEKKEKQKEDQGYKYRMYVFKKDLDIKDVRKGAE